MKLPLEITFRNVERTPEVEEKIRAKAAKLDRFYDRITGCRVVVEAPHKHQTKGNSYHIRIEVSVPGDELIVNRDPPNPDHEDLGVALRDAFAAAQRQVQSYAAKSNPSQSGAHRRIADQL